MAAEKTEIPIKQRRVEVDRESPGEPCIDTGPAAMDIVEVILDPEQFGGGITLEMHRRNDPSSLLFRCESLHEHVRVVRDEQITVAFADGKGVELGFWVRPLDSGQLQVLG